VFDMPQHKRFPIVQECNDAKLATKAQRKKDNDMIAHLYLSLVLLGRLVRAKDE